LNFSVNTDDPGIFECTLNSEFELLSTVFGFAEDDLLTICANSRAARFQPRLRAEPAALERG
jgi:adenosine deaminase